MAGPIKPEEVEAKRALAIPEAVFVAFNELIAARWDGHSSTVKLKDVAVKIANALEISTAEVYERRLLDVESTYREAGWQVKYDKPGYNEDYEAYFVFSKPRK